MTEKKRYVWYRNERPTRAERVPQLSWTLWSLVQPEPSDSFRRPGPHPNLPQPLLTLSGFRNLQRFQDTTNPIIGGVDCWRVLGVEGPPCGPAFICRDIWGTKLYWDYYDLENTTFLSSLFSNLWTLILHFHYQLTDDLLTSLRKWGKQKWMMFFHKIHHAISMYSAFLPLTKDGLSCPPFESWIPPLYR